jgi:N-acetylneuraminic acid mutarotase
MLKFIRSPLLALFALMMFGAGMFAVAPPPLDPLPVPVSNNAVASLKIKGQMVLFSFMGIGPKKTWDAVINNTFALDMDTGKWTELRAVPGAAGRIGASAGGAGDQIFLFGGYVVDAQGGEQTVPDANVYESEVNRWYNAADVPVPVDDSVMGIYRERYVYLISGWSKTDPVRNVQVYDVQNNTWQQGTPIPGTPVFGHAGALVGDTIVYVDGAYKNPAGAKPKFITSDECWMGKIDHKHPEKITWSKVPPHPGNARYRIAAGGGEHENRIYFSGGSNTPYNYNGIGYDGTPAEPSPTTFAYNLHSGKWETLSQKTPDPTMDHRGLLVTSEGLVIIGGMEKGQQVTARVALLPKQAK